MTSSLDQQLVVLDSTALFSRGSFLCAEHLRFTVRPELVFAVSFMNSAQKTGQKRSSSLARLGARGRTRYFGFPSSNSILFSVRGLRLSAIAYCILLHEERTLERCVIESFMDEDSESRGVILSADDNSYYHNLWDSAPLCE